MGKNTTHLQSNYVLCVTNRMFNKDSDRTDHPGYGKRFSILGVAFICKSKNTSPDKHGPIVGQFDDERHSDISNADCIDLLTSNGYLELSEEEKEAIFSDYAPDLKPVPEEME